MLGSLYAVIMKIVRIDLKSFLYGVLVLFALLIPSIILNSYFNNVCGLECNYFYIYNSDGVPFEALYIGERAIRMVHHQLDLYDSGRSDCLCGDVRDFQHPKTVLSER